jgi:hypothetical protein
MVLATPLPWQFVFPYKISADAYDHPITRIFQVEREGAIVAATTRHIEDFAIAG